jgi:hypothetical protein
MFLPKAMVGANALGIAVLLGPSDLSRLGLACSPDSRSLDMAETRDPNLLGLPWPLDPRAYKK